MLTLWLSNTFCMLNLLKQYSGEKVCLMLSSISDSTVEKRYVLCYRLSQTVQWRKGMPYAIIYLRQYSGEKVCLMLSSISDSTVEKRYALCYRLGHLWLLLCAGRVTCCSHWQTFSAAESNRRATPTKIFVSESVGKNFCQTMSVWFCCQQS